MKKIKLSIEGMHCASCAANVEKSLKRVAGVKEASVSLMLKKGRIEADDNVSDESLTKAVKAAGYNVSKVDHGA